MERKISIELYMLAFVIAAILFSIGVYVGTVINQGVMEDIGRSVQSLNQRISGLGLLLLEENDPAFCPFYRSELQRLDGEREELGYKISKMENEQQFYSPEVKREYMILQAQSYLFTKKIRDKCGDEAVFVLFFYDNKDCKDCSTAGDRVLRARDGSANKDKIKIYAFDGGIDSTVVQAFEKQYGVKSHPTTVINNATYIGAVSEEELRKAMENVD